MLKKSLMLKKATISRLQGLVDEVKTKVPAHAHSELHDSLHRLQEKIAKRMADPAMPAHPKVKAGTREVTIEIRRLQSAAAAGTSGERKYFFRSRQQPARPWKRKSLGGSKSTFQSQDVKRSLDRLNYYLALPGEDEPDVP